MGSRVYVMLHPLCQARLAKYRGEKGTNRQMNKGNRGKDSFLSGWLPDCDIAYVEVLLFHCSTAGCKSKIIQHTSMKSEQQKKKKKKELFLFMIMSHASIFSDKT